MRTILVIDDHAAYGIVLKRFLSRSGIDTLVVTSGNQGLELCKKTRPDLILLDWCLSTGFSGEETLRLFKSSPSTNGIPVVVMSGIKEDPQDEVDVRRAGADLFVTKMEIVDSVETNRVFLRRLGALLLGKKPPAKKLLHRAWATGRILLIEDEPEVNDMLAFFLRDIGYTLLTTATGSAGLLKAQQEHPDLVVLDLGLPDMDGLEVCNRLKSIPRTRPIPILILTSRSSTQARLLAIEHSADYFLAKPIVDFDEFHSWVAALLRRKSHFTANKEVIRIGDLLVVDINAHTLNLKDRTITDLPATLFRLICEFARHPGETLPRTYLVDRVWNNRVRDHNVDLAVNRLKKYLGVDNWFACVPGKGFRMIPGGLSGDKSLSDIRLP